MAIVIEQFIKALFRLLEQGFDKLFSYNRQLTETFDYRNTMKNDSTSVQLKLQEQELQANGRQVKINQARNQENNQTSSSFFSFTSLIMGSPSYIEEHMPKIEKKKKKKRYRL